MRKLSTIHENTLATSCRIIVIKSSCPANICGAMRLRYRRRSVIAAAKKKIQPNSGEFIDYEAAGKRIARIRKEKGMRQYELAKRAGISVQYMSAVESGHRRFSLELLTSVARELHVTPDEILFGTPPKAGNMTEDETEKEIQDLFLDTSPAEAAFLIKVLRASKEYLREKPGKK